MTAAASPGHEVPAASRPTRRARIRPVSWDIARSEWVKLYTVRSTYWTVLLAAAGMVAFGARS